VNELRKARKEIYYCEKCNDAVRIPHIDAVIGPLTVSNFRKPTNLFKAITDDDCEAQYWFSENSLKLITKTLVESGFDGILCIGTPTVFEYFQSSLQLRRSIRSFLLDFDSRFVSYIQLLYYFRRIR
ncbi:unnamed protein product, partial [Dracunculus medinensis]|uniref:Radical SAM protein n=1 Tax=Dracunculus medinensis TaxID=318479 RepID=A0A0N4UDR5_DRAME